MAVKAILFNSMEIDWLKRNEERSGGVNMCEF